MEPKIAALAEYWAKSPVFDAATQQEIRQLLDAKDSKELTERFYRDLEFGTGGLRGVIGAGASRMNIYNVRKASYAIANYLRECHGAQASIAVAISYDSRLFSREFAQAAAEVFVAKGIKALMTKELRPVPMLSFMVRYYKCQAGICLTASHNPPNYNGYKVYWQNGGQLVPPHDDQIIKRYVAVSRYEEIGTMPFHEGVEKGLISLIGEELDQKYFAEVEKLSLTRLSRDDFRVAYSPLHGTGAYPVTECLRRFGFTDVHVVPEQKEPNGRFPTVEFPNPEDPKAMRMAVDLARKVKADLVLATDPDSDRVGIAVREKDDYVFLNGNQIGCILMDYVLSASKAAGRLPDNPLVIKTIVTTEMQRKIAQRYGVACEDTLTGFKWICDLIEDYESSKRKPYKQYVCGGEESYGFMAGRFVRDKDGVSSCCLAAEAFAYYKAQGKSVTQVLRDLFRQHGVYWETLYTATLPGKDGAEKIKAIMTAIRRDPPRMVDGASVKLFRDIKAGQEFAVQGQSFVKTAAIDLPSSDVLQFVLADDTVVSVRPSGTEPKIKFYFSVNEPVAKDVNEVDLAAAQQRCEEKVARVQHAFVAMFAG